MTDPFGVTDRPDYARRSHDVQPVTAVLRAGFPESARRPAPMSTRAHTAQATRSFTSSPALLGLAILVE
ncbi:hypothetical protein ACWGQ5_47965 [Streptomyces sp. NPDC055722]